MLNSGIIILTGRGVSQVSISWHRLTPSALTDPRERCQGPPLPLIPGMKLKRHTLPEVPPVDGLRVGKPYNIP